MHKTLRNILVPILLLVLSANNAFAGKHTKPNRKKHEVTSTIKHNNLTWHEADSLLRLQLALCQTSIDSIRELREFTVTTVRGTFSMDYYNAHPIDFSYRLEDGYSFYTRDVAVAVCGDYANFFTKLLAYYGIESYSLMMGVPDSGVRGHMQVAVIFRFEGKEIVQVHDPNHNLEYVDENMKPLDLRRQIQLIVENNYADKIFALYGANTRKILLPNSYWPMIKMFYPNRHDVVGKAKSSNSQLPLMVMLKGSLEIMLKGDKKDTEYYLSKYVNYTPPKEIKTLQMLLPVAVFNIWPEHGKHDWLASEIEQARGTRASPLIPKSPPPVIVVTPAPTYHEPFREMPKLRVAKGNY